MNGEDNIWGRMEAALLKLAPRVLSSLAPPATEGAIADAEAAIGMRLPEAVRAAYLWHDGSSRGVDGFDGLVFPTYFSWASLSEVVTHHRGWCASSDTLRKESGSLIFPSPDDTWADYKVCPVWYDPHRMPIGITNTTTTLFVDMAPGPAGTAGQLIYDTGMGEAVWIADGLEQMFELLLERLQAGSIFYEEGWHWTRTGGLVYDLNLMP